MNRELYAKSGHDLIQELGKKYRTYFYIKIS